MLKIIAGKHKGKKLQNFANPEVRPTKSIMRESIFNFLSFCKIFNYQNIIQNALVLDLFCGTGVVGIEALSRGALAVTFVDYSKKSLQLVQNNLTSLNYNHDYDLVNYDIVNSTKIAISRKYNIIFMDPPYNKNYIPTTLEKLLMSNVLAVNALVIIESDSLERIKYCSNNFEQIHLKKFKFSKYVVLRYIKNI